MASTDTDDRVVVYLGNRDAVEVIDDPDDLTAAVEDRAPTRIRRPLPAGKRCTTVRLAPGLSLLEAVQELTHPQRGVWRAHSDADAPAWVASTDPDLAGFLSAHWQCERREPEPDHVPGDGDTPVEG